MTNRNTSGAVLVTGCSSGIGMATAVRLHQAGYPVYATARHPDTLADLKQDGISTLRLDVTDEDSMREAVGTVEREHGAVGVLVNNAGYESTGPVEEAPPEEIRRQFATNVLGLIRLTQLVLPGMRARSAGRIINISSVVGRFAVPGGAIYGASKHAVTGFTEALRREVAPSGIRVCLIEPAAVKSQFDSNAVRFGDPVDGPYAGLHQHIARWHEETYAGPRHNMAGRFAVTTDDVARVIAKAVASGRPRSRYPVGTIARGLFMLQRWLPAGAFDAFLRTQFPVP